MHHHVWLVLQIGSNEFLPRLTWNKNFPVHVFKVVEIIGIYYLTSPSFISTAIFGFFWINFTVLKVCEWTCKRSHISRADFSISFHLYRIIVEKTGKNSYSIMYYFYLVSFWQYQGLNLRVLSLPGTCSNTLAKPPALFTLGILWRGSWTYVWEVLDYNPPVYVFCIVGRIGTYHRA
jgi:hypothetical protein